MTMSARELWAQFEADEEERKRAGVEPHASYYDVMQTKALITIADQLEQIARQMDGYDEEE